MPMNYQVTIIVEKRTACSSKRILYQSSRNMKKFRYREQTRSQRNWFGRATSASLFAVNSLEIKPNLIKFRKRFIVAHRSNPHTSVLDAVSWLLFCLRFKQFLETKACFWPHFRRGYGCHEFQTSRPSLIFGLDVEYAFDKVWHKGLHTYFVFAVLYLCTNIMLMNEQSQSI